MSRPTTLMQKVSTGWNSICSSMKERLLPLLTTVISWIMSAGSILELDRGEGIPWKGKLLKLVGAEDQAYGNGRKNGQQAPQDPGT